MKMFVIILSLFMFFVLNSFARASDLSVAASQEREATSFSHGSYFDWGRGFDGWGHCYEWTNEGEVLNGGRPMPEELCEASAPSYFSWARGRDGYTYCYRFTPTGLPLNGGAPVPNSLCR